MTKLAGIAHPAPPRLRDVLDIDFTDEQLAAASAPLQPGLVVAGAGSGKTAVMAARVVWLTLTGAVRPDEVLGLTFTNKAAGELADRVRRALELTAPAVDRCGWGEPTVATYHGYAGRLLAEHGPRIGLEPVTRLLSDASRFQLARRAVCAHPGPVQELTAPIWMLVERVVALEAALSEQLVAPEALADFDRALLTELERFPEPHAELSRVAEVCRARLELGRLAVAYRAAKRAADALDFGDQTALAARLAEGCPEVAEGERQRYRVVLLDEYQDTSVAQRRMLVALFGRGHPVTAVGDPGQAIYGWRGASVANMAGFPTHFPQADGRPAARFELGVSLRSGANLLGLANAVSEPLRATELELPRLRPAPAAAPGELRCALHETWAAELGWLADQLVSAVADGLPAGRCAVLVRARSSLPALHEVLTRRGLPVEVVGLVDLLALPPVADLVATLRVLDDPTSNAALLRLLTGPRWRIGPRDLVALGRRAAAMAGPGGAAAGRPSEVADDVDAALERAVGLVDPAEVVSLADALEDPDLPGASAAARARVGALAAELRAQRRYVGEPLADLLGRVARATGLEVEVAASVEARQAGHAANLADFVHRAAQFSGLDGEVSLGAFLSYLAAAEEHEEGWDGAAPSGRDAVQLLTVHKAKGLEWDLVAVPDLCSGAFPVTAVQDRWTRSAQELPYPLRADADALPRLPGWDRAGLADFDGACAERLAREEQRLGYVAFTRARRVLLASGHWWGPSQLRPRGPSALLIAVRDHCRTGAGQVQAWAPAPAEAATNPQLSAAGGTPWPPPADGSATPRRRQAAAQVRAELLRRRGGAIAAAEDGPAGDPAVVRRAAEWDRDIEVLLAEANRSAAAVRQVPVPAVLSASRLVRLARDPDGLARELARPVPRRPVPAARRGTRLHAWLESRFTCRPLLGPDELPGAADEVDPAGAGLRPLQEAFLATEYAERQPVAVEAPFQLLLPGLLVTGRIDAVYRTSDGYEVVDWKTGRTEPDPLQLAVYRLAWAELQGMPADRVSAAFVNLADGEVRRFPDLPDAAALGELLAGLPPEARAAGPTSRGWAD